MDYRFLVQENLKGWETAGWSGGRCAFCVEFPDECGGCPLETDGGACDNMILNGMTYNENLGDEHYTRGCIAFYTEWLRTGVMPTVEYR